LNFIVGVSCPCLPAQLDIDVTSGKGAGLKLIVGFKTVHRLANLIEVTNRLPNGNASRRVQQRLGGTSQCQDGLKGRIAMRIEQLQIGPGILDMLRRRRPFAAGTDGIEALGIKGQRRFEADVTLPLGEKIVDVTETFAPLEAKRAQHNMSRVGTIAAIVLTKNVEVMQVLVAPVEEDLEHEMELCQRGVASDQEPTPDERTDASQDDAQLVDVQVYLVLVHAQSVRRNPCCFKGSPRNLALSSH
jgi:hypothetical protein